MPDISGDITASLLSVSAQLTGEMAKLAAKQADAAMRTTGNIAFAMLEALLKRSVQTAKGLTGSLNLEKILSSGQNIQMTEVLESDLGELRKQAKGLGVTLAIVKQKGSDTRTVLFAENEAERVRTALEKTVRTKLEKALFNNKEVKTEVEKNNLVEDHDRTSVKSRLQQIDKSKINLTHNMSDITKQRNIKMEMERM